MCMQVTSPAFKNGERIPQEYTCDGENISPELHIADVPEGTQSLVLIMEDPDVPTYVREDGMWDHWIVFNIDPSTTVIPKGTEPDGVHGITSSGTTAYGGPCPPDKEHRYFFFVYALSAKIDEQEGATKEAIRAAMRHHIIDKAELVGVYNRVTNS